MFLGPILLLLLLFLFVIFLFWSIGSWARFFWVVGIFIVIFAVGLLMPMPHGPHPNTRLRHHCIRNMKNIATALIAYEATKLHLPPAYSVDESGKPMHSWRVLILEQLGEGKLADQIRLDEPWDSEHNRQFHSKMPHVFRCPNGTGKRGKCHYSVVVGEETLFTGSQGVSKDQITDDRSTMILVVERKTPVCWMDPTQEITFADLSEIGSAHRGVNIMAFADGSARVTPEDIPSETLKAMLTKAGGEEVNDDDIW